jgi:hypothetical protein
MCIRRRDAKQVVNRIGNPAALAVIHTLYQPFRAGESS